MRLAQSKNNVSVPLEQLSPACGCAAKLGGTELTWMVASAFAENPGAGRSPAASPEDCAVLPPSSQRVLATVDFGPLVASDANLSGRIAAVHALSDVWATGGTPIAALATVVVDPSLHEDVPRAVLSGMVTACLREGVTLAGGHTIFGCEALAGLAVVGQAGARVLGKGGARPGQLLLISKPLGVGLVVRAHRAGLLADADVEVAHDVMEKSNRGASEAALRAGVRTATDVTGYGLLGHLAEMLAPERLGARIEMSTVPVLGLVRELPPPALRSRWIENNASYCRELMPIAGSQQQDVLAPLLDPQTSGGLLVAADAEQSAELLAAGFRLVGTVTNTDRMEILT